MLDDQRPGTVYWIDHYVVGGFYRVHTERGQDQNLNAPGMQFAPLAFAAPCSSPDPADPGCPPNRFYAYGVIARLALVAAAVELEHTVQDAPSSSEHTESAAMAVDALAISLTLHTPRGDRFPSLACGHCLVGGLIRELVVVRENPDA